MAMTLLCYLAFVPYLIDGPLEPTSLPDIDNCQVSWWATLLMVNNFVHKDKPVSGFSHWIVSQFNVLHPFGYFTLVAPSSWYILQCMVWSPQLSVLVQLQLTSFLILILLIKYDQTCFQFQCEITLFQWPCPCRYPRVAYTLLFLMFAGHVASVVVITAPGLVIYP